MKKITWAISTSYPILLAMVSFASSHYILGWMSVISTIIFFPKLDELVDSSLGRAIVLILLRVSFIVGATYTVATSQL